MSSRPQTRSQQLHSAEIRQVYERLLAGSPVRSRHVEVAGHRVHLLEQGAGPPVVLFHGTANPAGFLLPLLRELHGVRAIAPDAGTRNALDVLGPLIEAAQAALNYPAGEVTPGWTALPDGGSAPMYSFNYTTKP